MYRKYNLTVYSIVLCVSLAATTSAFTDCATGIPDSSCPAGTINGILGSNAQAQAQRDAEAQAQREAELRRYTDEGAAAAADPRNRNDPNSPYYWVRQCENAKHTIFCAFGIACEPAADLDCARAGARPAANRRH